MKKRILSIMTCMMILFGLSVRVSALEVPDLEQKGSICVTMTHQGTAVPGGALTIYHVAQVVVENGADYSFRYTGSYENCSVTLDALTDPNTAKALAAYSVDNEISGSVGTIDETGTVRFEDLELGLYLLVQNEAAAGYQPVNPFLVTVPSYEAERYVYDVDASPKLSLEPMPTEPTEPSTEPTEPPDPELPQTGVNQWPVPVLAISGLFLVVLGWTLVCGGNKRIYEN